MRHKGAGRQIFEEVKLVVHRVLFSVFFFNYNSFIETPCLSEERDLILYFDAL